VTAWEIFSYGEQPYAEMKNLMVFEQVNDGYKLPLPPLCPEKFYEKVIFPCFNMEASGRPRFADLEQTLQTETFFDINVLTADEADATETGDSFVVLSEEEHDYCDLFGSAETGQAPAPEFLPSVAERLAAQLERYLDSPGLVLFTKTDDIGNAAACVDSAALTAVLMAAGFHEYSVRLSPFPPPAMSPQT